MNAEFKQWLEDVKELYPVLSGGKKWTSNDLKLSDWECLWDDELSPRQAVTLVIAGEK